MACSLHVTCKKDLLVTMLSKKYFDPKFSHTFLLMKFNLNLSGYSESTEKQITQCDVGGSQLNL